MTKLYTISLLAIVAATPAFAGSPSLLPVDSVDMAAPAGLSFGGFITAYYGATAVTATTSDDDYHGDYFDRIGVEGSVGRAANGGFGWQLDAQYETANFTDVDDEFADTYALSAHGYFDLGGVSIGGFAGVGQGDWTTHPSNTADAYWYGLDVAKSFGDFALSGQVGFATIDNEHTALSSENQLFVSVEGHYFIGENMMIGANIGGGQGVVHGLALIYTEWGVDATMRLGQSNFYGTVGYTGSQVDLEGSGMGAEQTFYAGISMLFGGGLRDVYTGSTPMVGQSMIPYIGVMSAVNDD